MDCNKEEALRAKGIAENKMQAKDFVGARKIVLKAQQLFPDLENLSQMLTVCEVHCSAGNVKLNGETDWYGILQVEPTSDELTIKKQYRKLALLLHPDKNQFAGAEAAFKLVGEAHRTLSDQAKRSLHDMKRAVNFKPVPLWQPTQPPRRQPGTSNIAAKKSSTQFNGSNPPLSSTLPTFWTICPFCGIRYQYYRTILNRSLRCQNCMKPFIAYDLNEQAVPRNPTGVPQHKFRGPGAHMAGFQGNEGGRSTSSQPGDGSKSKVTEDKEVKFEKVKLQEVNKREPVVKSSAQNARKRSRNIVVESIDSGASDSDEIKVKGGHPSGGSVGKTGSYPRRSPRQKQNVSHQEGETVNTNPVHPFKESRKGGTSSDANGSGGAFSELDSNGIKVGTNGTCFSSDKKDDKQEGNPSVESLINDVSSKANPTSTDSDSLSYPDPEFFDFEKERDPAKFAVDQIWAVYDDVDGMPRFYARIRDVYGPHFKLRFTWLEHDPVGKAEVEGSEEDLPVTCGTFRLGKSEFTKEQLMFSHPMTWQKGVRRNSYVMHPRKGEVWALFKGSDVRWSSDAGNHRNYDFDVVEVLSEDYKESGEITVVRLVKINGFVSLFMRAVDKGVVPLGIPCSEVLRFSHQIPSYRMNGDEREGIPSGSFELDTAALPTNFAETCDSISLESTKVRVEGLDDVLRSKSPSEEEPSAGATKMSGSRSDDVQPSKSPSEEDPSAGATKMSGSRSEEKNAHERQRSRDESTNGLNGVCEKEQILSSTSQDSSSEAREHHNPSPVPSPPHIFEYPDPEFHDFEEARSYKQFKRGQIWALYSEIDRCPKYYARIKDVAIEGIKLQIMWLRICPVGKEEARWQNEDLPISCGTFKVVRGETVLYDTTDTFSHLVCAVPEGRRDYYNIYPIPGEVWALYKNWSNGWSRSDLESCEYDIVEILDRSDSGIKALVLTKVDGFSAVFTTERSTMDIASGEYVRFSHQIPAFRLTEERGGKLRGYWELDPASVPEVLLFKK